MKDEEKKVPTENEEETLSLDEMESLAGGISSSLLEKLREKKSGLNGQPEQRD